MLATLDQQCLDVFEDYIDADLNNGRYGQLATQLRQHLTAQPLRERAWAQLMLVHYRSGDVAAALATYREARHTLRQHLGIDPAQELTELHQAMLWRDPALDVHPARIRFPAAGNEHTASRQRNTAQSPVFAEEAHLAEADIRMLSAIQLEGQAPRTPERWRYIYTAIRTSEVIDR